MKRKILILCPHTDDGEFGCGGTIVKFLNQGHNIHYCAFSSCGGSVMKGFDKDALIGELYDAMGIMGVRNVHLFDYYERQMKHRRQEILDDMIVLRNQIKPDVIFLPSVHDTHQDHQVISEEGFRAFKESTIFGYEIPWNCSTFDTTCFIRLKREELDKKVKAIMCYRSQLDRPYFSETSVRGLASVRGVQIGGGLAECFEVMRLIIK